ncbi:jasmonate O-methyltransferase-like protein [Corchorus olitorius]|uniref:Jasmonate O-methyltransferase-like protein n=1 Tax=Corchorus olitorius TaxID=93759 RepID=A0A1R3I0Y9_9ROSI|nr:jasmonate O-methyltransferase-like protein [Corchorus olitorius]
MAMEVKDMLFMNKGDGENSYVKSSGYTVLNLKPLQI